LRSGTDDNFSRTLDRLVCGSVHPIRALVDDSDDDDEDSSDDEYM
jgi:hypothetical protein